MKVVINTCYGGFGISAVGLSRYCKLTGRPAYFFLTKPDNDFVPVSAEEADANGNMWFAFDIENPKDFDSTVEGKNKLWDRHHIGRDFERNDPALVQVVEDLKERSFGGCARLAVIEIPDNIKWHVEEYDGVEWIAEDHRRWDEDGEYGQIK